MTIEHSSDGTVTADYARANDISMQILSFLRAEPIGYGAMGCALTIGRLANPDVRLSPFTEVKFVGELMEWVDDYFTIDVTGEPN